MTPDPLFSTPSTPLVRGDRAALNRLLGLTARVLGVPTARLWWPPEQPSDGTAGEEALEWLCLQTLRAAPEEPLVYPGAALSWPPELAHVSPPAFYAGVALRGSAGQPLGVLYVTDGRPRAALTAGEQDSLTDLAALVAGELERSGAGEHGLLHAIIEHTADAVYVKDRTGRYLLVNPAAAAMLERSPREILGQTDAVLFGPDDQQRIRGIEETVVQTRGPVTYERTVPVAGEAQTFLTSKFPFVAADGTVQGVVGMSRNITDRKRMERALQEANAALEQRVAARTETLTRLAREDPVTGLGNRRAFDADLEAQLASLPPGEALHLLLLDVNAFKAWNDVHGHAAGDALLRALAEALREACPAASAYRLGGDEFALIGRGGPGVPAELRAGVRAAEAAVQAAGFAELSCSVGLASHPAEATTPSTLARLADQRMLHEKAARRADQGLGDLTGAPPDERALELAGEVTFKALRATLAVLAQDEGAGQDVWTPLLEAAVAAVPGAESGSLSLRERAAFVLQAQVGFSGALVGVRQPASAAHVWYGTGTAPQTGRARVLTRGGIQQRLREAAADDGWTQVRPDFEAHGELTHLQANICVPVILEGQAVAYLNLDNLQDSGAFTARSADIAEAFATQIAALLAARQRQTREAERRRELEGLLSVTAALREVADAGQVGRVLTGQAAMLLGTEYVGILNPGVPSGGERSAEPGAGPDLTWGQEPARQALETGAVVRVNPGAGDGRAVMAAPLHRSDGGPAALVVARDHPQTFSALDAQLLGGIAAIGTTALERLEGVEALQVRAEEFRMLSDLSHVTATLTDPAQVARRSLAECRTFLGADFAAFASLDLGTVVTDGHAPADFLAEARRRLLLPTWTDGAENLRAFEATSRYPQEPGADPRLVAAGLRGVMGAPVHQDGHTAGRIYLVWFRECGALPSAARPLVDRAAELIGQALERRAHLATTEATREGALLALGLALELRDFETAGHTARVVRHASRLGELTGLAPDALEGLRQGAYLHDIGKLAVPDRILLKPGPLEAAEWAVMQSHAVVGSELTRSIPTLHPLAREVILHHHERWNGHGYPGGLAGEAIPLAARVFSVVDAYDALTSHRPYKAAWTPEAALAELRSQAGQQFDPTVVRLFAALLEAERTNL